MLRQLAPQLCKSGLLDLADTRRPNPQHRANFVQVQLFDKEQLQHHRFTIGQLRQLPGQQRAHLRAFDARTRVGSSTGTAVDVRIISATHCDMDAAIADGRFRQDLFFRLGVVLVHVPALAERREDIPLLIRHFQKGKPSGAIAHFDQTALEKLMVHGWPGNVRELRNVVERAGVLYGGEMLNGDDVDLLLANAAPPLDTQRERSALPPMSFVPAGNAPSKDQPIDLRQEIEAIELERITMALELADGIVSEAARLLTLKRTTLIEKMRKYGVQAVA